RRKSIYYFQNNVINRALSRLSLYLMMSLPQAERTAEISLLRSRFTLLSGTSHSRILLSRRLENQIEKVRLPGTTFLTATQTFQVRKPQTPYQLPINSL